MEYFWANVQVDIETARGVAVPITAITKASPAVVTYSGAALVVGDAVVLAANGMNEVNKRAFRIAAPAAGTFALEDENSTDYNAFVSGSFSPIAFGVSMTTVQDVDGSGGEPEYKDLNTIHNLVKRRAPTSIDPFNLKFGCLFDPADPAHIELKRATLGLKTRVVRLRLASGVQMLGEAYVSAIGVPTGQAQDVIKTTVSLEFQGLPTITF